MEQEELVPLTIWLSGRSYRILIRPSQQDLVVKAIRSAEEKVMEMRQHYAGKDDQDFIAMALLTYAVNTATEFTFNPVLQEELNDINRRLDDVLGSLDEK